MRVGILASRSELSVTDLLVMIEAVVAGNSVGNSDSEKIIGPSLKSEHLEADEQGSQRTVGDAAEQASPKVAPMNRDGTISPPLKPAAMETAVNNILTRKA